MSTVYGERPPTDPLLDGALRAAFTKHPRAASDAPPNQSLPPERICRVEHEIARGGMGVVYRAHDPSLAREVALKLLREDLAGDTGAVRRFLEEARIGGRLQHPGVVPVYALGRTATGRPWFTMKLIEGRTFASILSERTDPAQDLRRFLTILESVCRTIAYAHDRGVVHLDLKPGNVMVGAFGEVQVVDWGLAALVRSSRSEVDAQATDGAVYGTPAYMPPEQARGESSRIDERADVFALGAILCEVLTGAPPYDRGREASRREAASARLDGAHERLRHSAAADLAVLCQACLAADPEQRRTSAGEIASRITGHFATLEERMRGAQIAAAEARTRASQERRARRLTVALAGSVLLTLALASAVWAWQIRAEAQRNRAADARARTGIEEAARLLGQAESSADLELYAKASAAVERATAALAGGAGSPVVRSNAAALADRIHAEDGSARARSDLQHSNRRLLERLTELRVPDEAGDEVLRDRAYGQAFRDAGMDADATSPEAFAAEARRRGIDVLVAGAIDEWIDVREAACLFIDAARLRHLVRLVDPDPVRTAGRDAVVRSATADLVPWIDREDLSKLEPGTFHAVGRVLSAHGIVSPRNEATHLYRIAHAVHPGDPTIAVELARALFYAGQAAEGEAMYRLAQSLRPGDPTAYLELAWELDHGNIDHAAAVDLLERAIAVAPEYGLSYFLLGRALRSLKDLDGAMAAQREAARRMPDDARPHKELAVLYRMTGADELVLQEFERALAMSPNYLPARVEYATALSERGRLGDAVGQMRRVIGAVREPDQSVWEGRLAELLLSHGEYEAAARSIRATRLPSSATILPLYERGIRLRDFFDLESMQAACEQYVEEQPTEPNAYCQLGAILEARGRCGEALLAFRVGQLLGSRQQGWDHPSEAWVARAARLASTERRIEEALAGGIEPRGADEAYEWGLVAARKGLYVASARWFAAARGASAQPFARLEAACACVRAASSVPDSERAAWLACALDWLREDMTRCGERITTGGGAAVDALCVLGAWRTAGELERVRDAGALLELPEDERAAWESAWESVATLCAAAARAR